MKHRTHKLWPTLSLAFAGNALAQCPVSTIITQSVVPTSCHGTSQLVATLQAGPCALQVDFVLPPPSPNTFPVFYLLGFGWSMPPAPCAWLPQPSAVLLLPSTAAPSWTLPLPPTLQPLTFLLQGAVVIQSTLSSHVGFGQVGTLQVTLQ